jgi:hypothetical protein
LAARRNDVGIESVEKTDQSDWDGIEGGTQAIQWKTVKCA